MPRQMSIVKKALFSHKKRVKMTELIERNIFVIVSCAIDIKGVIVYNNRMCRYCPEKIKNTNNGQ